MGASLSTLSSTTQFQPSSTPPEPTPILFLSCFDDGRTTIIHHLVHVGEKAASSSPHAFTPETHMLHYPSLSSYPYPPPSTSSSADTTLILTPAPQPTPNHALLQRTFSILELTWTNNLHRSNWPYYMSESAATVFVINSVLFERDPDCLSEVCSELRKIFFHASTDSFPTDTLENRKNPHSRTGGIILILATKQDLQVSMSTAELMTALNLPLISHNSRIAWRIQGVSCITGEGLYEAFDWLCVQLNAQKPFVGRGYRTAAEDFRIQCSRMQE